MTTATKPATVETRMGPKLLICPNCERTDHITADPDHWFDEPMYREWYCAYCDRDGYLVDLDGAPDEDASVDDTHARYGDIGPIIPPMLSIQCAGRGIDGSICYGVAGRCEWH